MFNNQNRIRDLEQENHQWQQWYLSQQMSQQQPHFAHSMPAAKKKKLTKKTKIRADMSNEAKLWIAIIILSFFSFLVVKNWLTDINKPESRVEQKAKTKKTY